MQPIPKDVNLDDVWQWLNRGWFYYDKGTELVPACMVQHDRHEFMVQTTEGDEYGYQRDKCYPHWPRCGAINLQGLAVIVERTQQRQYRRTYNSRCVLLNVPRKWDAMKRHPWVKNITPENPEVVNALFKPEYFNYDRALELLDAGWVSVALNPYLVIAGTRDEQLVYYRSKLTARVSEGRYLPLDESNPRALRILKFFNGRVRYANDRKRSA